MKEKIAALAWAVVIGGAWLCAGSGVCVSFQNEIPIAISSNVLMLSVGVLATLTYFRFCE